MIKGMMMRGKKRSNKTNTNIMTIEKDKDISHSRRKDENYQSGIEDHPLDSEIIF